MEMVRMVADTNLPMPYAGISFFFLFNQAWLSPSRSRRVGRCAGVGETRSLLDKSTFEGFEDVRRWSVGFNE